MTQNVALPRFHSGLLDGLSLLFVPALSARTIFSGFSIISKFCFKLDAGPVNQEGLAFVGNRTTSSTIRD